MTINDYAPEDAASREIGRLETEVDRLRAELARREALDPDGWLVEALYDDGWVPGGRLFNIRDAAERMAEEWGHRRPARVVPLYRKPVVPTADGGDGERTVYVAGGRQSGKTFAGKRAVAEFLGFDAESHHSDD